MTQPWKERPPVAAAAAMGLAVFVLYVVTLAPTTAFWDTSEYIATAHILGIPHPPGNPLFVVLAKVWTLALAPLGLSVAVRVNLFAAATSAAAGSFLFLVAHRLLLPVLGDRRRALVGGAVSALVGATAFTVWNQSNVNEKVYTLSVLVIAAVTWLGVRWRDRRGAAGADRYLLVALFLMVLGSTSHLMSVLPLPAFAVFVLLTDARVVMRGRLWARAGLLVALGLSFNYVLPVRAELDPVINEGDPTCESFLGATQAIYSNGMCGCPALAENLSRVQYQKPPVTRRMAPWSAQLENYFQYFDWQWARGVDPSELPGTARLPLTLLFLGLGGAGFWAVWRADRVVAAYLGVLMLTLSVGLVFYLNFKFGYSLAPEVADRELHEVRERDYFFVASFLMWGAMAGIGLSWVWAVLASLSHHARRWAVTSPVLAFALLPLLLNWGWASRSGDFAARDWAYDLLMSVEPYGVLFTHGDNDTFPLWYLQEVEGIRRDVTVVVGQYLYTSWYPKQLKSLTEPARQRPFIAEQTPGLYEAPSAPPSGPILTLQPEEMDRVVGVRLDRDLTIPMPDIAVTFPEGMVLERGDQLALSIIHDAAAERPIYFASSAGMMSNLGLRPWGIRHGLVVKLVLRSLDGASRPGIVRGSPELGGEHIDLERSLRLYDDVYAYRGLRDRAIWQDRSTLNIPFQFYLVSLLLADAARVAGLDQDTVRRLEDDATDFQLLAAGGARGRPGT
jgi:hypothetical protein